MAATAVGRWENSWTSRLTMTTMNTRSPVASRNSLRGSEVIVVQRLNKIFRDFWMRARVRAVEDVSFEVHPGEVFGLLGPNGSGKSTTIKIMLGLLHKTSGLVSVFGKLPTDVAVKKRIGYLPEESYLYPFLNARETLDYYGKLFELDGTSRKRRIDELLDMVGLTGVQFRPVREYSKGMQRRIGIAQALINDPELLILDEPTTGLDPIGTRQIKDLILELARRGKTVVLSSHLLADVEDCVHRMVILYGGRVRAAGTCESLLESSERSIIETDHLDEETISRIDRLIRERTGGQSAIDRVSRPRQKLEDLFIDIVEKAQAERLATAGAQHGGETAAFLRGEEAGGQALIDNLLKVESAVQAPETQPEKRPQAGPNQDVLKDLLNKSDSAPAAPSTPARAAAPTAPTKDVDRGVIGSLLDGDGRSGKDPERRP